MNNWEPSNTKIAFDLLYGDYYGEFSEKSLQKIISDRIDRSNYLEGILNLNSSSIVLEIGSGMGYTSKFISEKVAALHCCDISETFLNSARENCQERKNAFFYKINVENTVLPFSQNYFDAIYADAVFIHLNLFDIYLYFAEFEKVIKKGGKVWFTIMDPIVTDMSKLTEMATIYKNNKNLLSNCLCWNAPETVLTVASHFGFKLISKGPEFQSISLLFIKE